MEETSPIGVRNVQSRHQAEKIVPYPSPTTTHFIACMLIRCQSVTVLRSVTLYDRICTAIPMESLSKWLTFIHVSDLKLGVPKIGLQSLLVTLLQHK